MNTVTPVIKVAIADDHDIFRKGLRLALNRQKQIELIAEAADGRELITCVDKRKPDVVITDIKMPLLNGKEACKIIKARFPQTSVIALSMLDDQDSIVEMLDAGASGYL